MCQMLELHEAKIVACLDFVNFLSELEHTVCELIFVVR